MRILDGDSKLEHLFSVAFNPPLMERLRAKSGRKKNSRKIHNIKVIGRIYGFKKEMRRDLWFDE